MLTLNISAFIHIWNVEIHIAPQYIHIAPHYIHLQKCGDVVDPHCIHILRVKVHIASTSQATWTLSSTSYH